MKKVFFGHSTDQSIQYHAASGGVITSLVLHLLKQKMIDKVLVTKIDGFTAVPILTCNKNDVRSAQGSIYFKTFSLRILKKLLSNLKKRERICVVGLPCQISVLRKVLVDFQDKLYFLSLICSHVNEIWYLHYIIEKHLPKIAKPIAIGPRKDGWPGESKIFFELNGNLKELAIPQSKFWGFLPSLNISTPLGCLLCADHSGSNADIVAGDAWHPRYEGKSLSGVSTIIVRTPQGLRLVKEAIENEALYAEETNLADLLIAQGLHLVEGIEYVPLRQKILKHQIAVLRELNNIDKVITVFLIMANQYVLRFKSIRQLLNTSLAENTLKIILRLLSQQKRKRLSQVTQSILKSNFTVEYIQ